MVEGYLSKINEKIDLIHSLALQAYAGNENKKVIANIIGQIPELRALVLAQYTVREALK